MPTTYYHYNDDYTYSGYVYLLDGMTLADTTNYTQVKPPNPDPGTGTKQVFDPATKTWSVPSGSATEPVAP